MNDQPATELRKNGTYKVVLPMLPRHRTRKYVVVYAAGEAEAIEAATRIVELDREIRGLHPLWWLDLDCEVETIEAPVFETVEAKTERNDRAREIAKANRARRADRNADGPLRRNVGRFVS